MPQKVGEETDLQHLKKTLKTHLFRPHINLPIIRVIPVVSLSTKSKRTGKNDLDVDDTREISGST